MSTARRTRILAGAAFGFVLFSAFLVVFSGGYRALMEAGRAGHWSWWQYSLAVPAFGMAAIVLEGIAAIVIAPLGWVGSEHGPSRRAVGTLFWLVVMVAAFSSPWWLAAL